MRSEPGGLMGGLLQPRGTALKQPTAPPRGQGAAALPAFVQRGRAAPLRARRTRRAGQQQRQCASATASVTAAAAASAPPVALHSRQLQQFVCGGLAGTVTKTLVAPLERISTIMAVSRRASMGQAVQAALQDGGAAGLWRGNWATVLKVGCAAVNHASCLLPRPGCALRPSRWSGPAPLPLTICNLLLSFLAADLPGVRHPILRVPLPQGCHPDQPRGQQHH